MIVKILVSQNDKGEVISIGWFINGNPFMTPLPHDAAREFVYKEMLDIGDRFCKSNSFIANWDEIRGTLNSLIRGLKK